MPSPSLHLPTDFNRLNLGGGGFSRLNQGGDLPAPKVDSDLFESVLTILNLALFCPLRSGGVDLAG